MNIIAKAAVLTATAVLCLTGAARAADDVTVSANRTSVIGHFAIVEKDTCYHTGKPTISISRQPAHGTARAELLVRTSTNNKDKRCNGRPIYGAIVYYTPDKGYTGKDVVRIGLRTITYGTNSHYHGWKVNVTVQ